MWQAGAKILSMLNGVEIGRRVREARHETGLSMSRLAELAKTSHGYISQLEAGGIDSPGTALLSRIAQALDRPVEYFMGLSEEDPEEVSPYALTDEQVIREYARRSRSHDAKLIELLLIELKQLEREDQERMLARLRRLAELRRQEKELWDDDDAGVLERNDGGGHAEPGGTESGERKGA